MKENSIIKKKDPSILNNRYTLGKKIGEGGLSEVYEAQDIYAQYFEDNKSIVIKIPSYQITDKKDVAAFVYSEYSLLSSLNHENIVKAIDFGIDDKTNIAYLVMEKLEGELLVNVSLHKIDKQMKRNMANSLYKALVHIHSRGIIHADINPTNIMISPDGNAKIFDFGISQNIALKKQFSLEYKKINAYNPIYTAPEVVKGSLPSSKTDFFSLACVLYELYANELPFKKSSYELLKAPVSIKQLSKLPFFQRYWFKKALSYDPEKRPKKPPLSIVFLSYLKHCI
ncbi:Serine/threonine protein kinase PrkC, regulator of stationary phase [hydrothermal vent metagenome]|uniref:Serine/threonine protein kinase PrkC, regulator of stationary phase n=1 Tax=hydrothermal vent metagenome TaxID=652676 RepID=A0A1W1BUQ5_9ZZZZ